MYGTRPPYARCRAFTKHGRRCLNWTSIKFANHYCAKHQEKTAP